MPSNIICMGKELDCIYKCIKDVETGGQPDDGCYTVGDNGASHGSYQIQQSTIDYASRYDPTLKGVKATDLSARPGTLTCQQRIDLSKKIMDANWAQAATANPDRKKRQFDCEDLARIHNGGPSGDTKDSTKDYWKKVDECRKKCMGEGTAVADAQTQI